MGKKRCDFSAAISIEQLNQLHKEVGVLNKLYGDGSMELNDAEKMYSSYGPMKMAAIAIHSLVKGEKLSKNDFHFRRTSQVSDISQLDILEVIGNKLASNIKANQVILSKHIEKD